MEYEYGRKKIVSTKWSKELQTEAELWLYPRGTLTGKKYPVNYLFNLKAGAFMGKHPRVHFHVFCSNFSSIQYYFFQFLN